jgi:putative Holliday junction resolvase
MQVTKVLGLDVGEKRIGLATADLQIGIAYPLKTIPNDADVWRSLQTVLDQEEISQVVVGLPRNLSGDDTHQTRFTKNFVEELRAHFSQPIQTQDEALTSHKAKEELEARKKPYEKGDIDMLAATYILQDFLEISRTA